MSQFSKKLLEWYEKNRRVLPWREDPTPYHVLLSEIMLQQTRVDTALPYYEAFLARFPTLNDLAEAEEEEVLRLWQGLGYYSRARNLHALAKDVKARFSGKIPSNYEDLLSLPGVGPYCASAISAIAFDLPFVAVDGNLLRVYCRLATDESPISKESTKNQCRAYFLERMESPSAFNQALMDLGELVCAPLGAPKCEQCPLKEFCKAHRQGNPMDYPKKAEKAKVQKQRWTLLLSLVDGSIGVRKRPETGLLASMYEFPSVPGSENKAGLMKEYGIQEVVYLGKCSHRFSHLEWDMSVYLSREKVSGLTYIPLNSLKEKVPLPTAFAKALKLI